jgi:hypothetical protein
MEVKEVEAAEMVAEEEAVGMEDLSVGVVAYPHPPLLSLVSREEAVGSIPMAAEAIGMIQETIKTFDQQGAMQSMINRGGNAGREVAIQQIAGARDMVAQGERRRCNN